jgi:hypothetical protein
VPTPVWGRDAALHPPPGGRAPGWRAGLVVARRKAGSDLVGRGLSGRGARDVSINHPHT